MKTQDPITIGLCLQIMIDTIGQDCLLDYLAAPTTNSKDYTKQKQKFARLKKRKNFDPTTIKNLEDFANFEKDWAEWLIKDGYAIKIKTAEVSLRQNKLSVALLAMKESDLKMQYSKTVAQAKTTFMGKELNFYGLLKEMQNEDREIRKEALNVNARGREMGPKSSSLKKAGDRAGRGGIPWWSSG